MGQILESKNAGGYLLQTVQIGEWTVRQRIPPGSGPHPAIVMLHGWTGDEGSMWIFIHRLPREACIIAPRGLYTTPLGGYGWHPHKPRTWPWVDDFLPAVEKLAALLTAENFPQVDLKRFQLVGFSQGAAMAYAFALLHPERVVALAGLAGFAPDGAITLAAGQPLRGVPAFISHGTQDKLVPVDRARRSAELLQEAGANVTYCEDEVGHKLSADCFSSLESFLQSNR